MMKVVMSLALVAAFAAATPAQAGIFSKLFNRNKCCKPVACCEEKPACGCEEAVVSDCGCGSVVTGEVVVEGTHSTPTPASPSDAGVDSAPEPPTDAPAPPAEGEAPAAPADAPAPPPAA